MGCYPGMINIWDRKCPKKLALEPVVQRYIAKACASACEAMLSSESGLDVRFSYTSLQGQVRCVVDVVPAIE